MSAPYETQPTLPMSLPEHAAPKSPHLAGVLPILPQDFAAELAARAGQPYRPSNGTEGEIFHNAACARCAKWVEDEDTDPHGRNSCTIEIYAWAFGIDEPKYPKEWVYGPDGQPTCLAFDLNTGGADQ